MSGGRRNAAAKWTGSVPDPMIGADGQPIDDVGPGAQPRVAGATLEPVAASRQLPHDTQTWEGLVERGDVISPPYDPWSLVCTVEESGALPYLIDTVATNVSGFGIKLEPTFATRDEDGKPIKPPQDAEEQRKRLELFLVGCQIPHGLQGLMDLVDRDTETIGWGALEVLRDRTGAVAALEHVRGYQLRLGKLSPPILVDLPIVDPGSGQIVTLPRWKRFRSYVQIVEGAATYFRDFGDPRPMYRATGDSLAAGQVIAPAQAATEILFFRIYAPHTAYGVPRWIGGAAHARAEREAADLVISWFLDAPIGAKLAMIAGGSWKDTSVKAALQKIDRMARGRENAWSLVMLEAEKLDAGAFSEETGGGSARIGLEDLAYELPPELYHGEGNLIDESGRRLGRMFRLPPVYWGGSDDFSKAAVNGAKAAAEEQTIRPIRRTRWENRMNHELLPSMGINRWRLALAGASTTDDTEIAGAISAFVEGGGVSPNALIAFWNELSGQNTDPIAEPWGDRPLSLVLELVKAKADPNLPLEELAAAWDEQATAAADAQAEALAARAAGPPGAGGGPPGKKVPPGKGPPGKAPPAAKATLQVDQAEAIKSAIAWVAEIAQHRDALKAAAEDDPTWYQG